jgi:hypothetical protein
LYFIIGGGSRIHQHAQAARDHFNIPLSKFDRVSQR